MMWPVAFHHGCSTRAALPLALVLSVLLVVGGCRTLDDGPSREAATGLVEQRVSVEAVGEPPDAATPTPTPWADTGVLTPQDAVAMALRRHPSLAADMAQIQQAHADWVQAGLLPNPVLDGALGLDSGGNVGRLAASLTQTLTALWLLPPREAVAEAQLNEVIQRVGHDALDLAAEVEQAHRRTVHHQRMIGLLHEEEQLLERMVQVAVELVEVGLADALQVSRVQRKRHLHTLEQEEARTALAGSQRNLLELMGLADAETDWEAVYDCRASDPQLNEREAVQIGLAWRLDVQAARWGAIAADHQLDLARRSAWPSVRGGVAVEHEEDLTTFGPTVGIELPIFDQGQARVAGAEAERGHQRAQHEVTVQRATREIREAWTRLTSQQRQVDYHQRHLLPHAEAAVDQAQVALEVGDADRLEVLRARRDALESRKAAVKTRLQRDSAWIDYKRAMGWADLAERSDEGR